MKKRNTFLLLTIAVAAMISLASRNIDFDVTYYYSNEQGICIAKTFPNDPCPQPGIFDCVACEKQLYVDAECTIKAKRVTE